MHVSLHLCTPTRGCCTLPSSLALAVTVPLIVIVSIAAIDIAGTVICAATISSCSCVLAPILITACAICDLRLRRACACAWLVCVINSHGGSRCGGRSSLPLCVRYRRSARRARRCRRSRTQSMQASAEQLPDGFGAACAAEHDEEVEYPCKLQVTASLNRPLPLPPKPLRLVASVVPHTKRGVADVPVRPRTHPKPRADVIAWAHVQPLPAVVPARSVTLDRIRRGGRLLRNVRDESADALADDVPHAGNGCASQPGERAWYCMRCQGVAPYRPSHFRRHDGACASDGRRRALDMELCPRLRRDPGRVQDRQQ